MFCDSLSENADRFAPFSTSFSPSFVWISFIKVRSRHLIFFFRLDRYDDRTAIFSTAGGGWGRGNVPGLSSVFPICRTKVGTLAVLIILLLQYFRPYCYYFPTDTNTFRAQRAICRGRPCQTVCFHEGPEVHHPCMFLAMYLDVLLLSNSATKFAS